MFISNSILVVRFIKLSVVNDTKNGAKPNYTNNVFTIFFNPLFYLVPKIKYSWFYSFRINVLTSQGTNGKNCNGYQFFIYINFIKEIIFRQNSVENPIF